jgi:hypothetical protein
MTRPWETQPWFELYRLAVLETDGTKLPDRLHAAKAAIKERLAELGDLHDIPEMGALRNALAVLQLLEKHEK